jgi:acetylornithine deacetylase/succinyl-diaminopimelate desuccinylase-like protein
MSLADTLIELINIPSVIGNEEEITTAIEFRLAAVRTVRRLGNALVVGEPTGKPIIVLYGHTDTVPEQGNGTASVQSERIHGLGASDMKAGLAVMVHLLEATEIIEGPYDVVGIFYDKEEGPSVDNGLEDILDAVPWLADAVFSIVLEPTDLNLELGCNGAMNADIVFNGHAAHSARPWLGENAVTKAGVWLAEMHDRRPEPVEIAGVEILVEPEAKKALERWPGQWVDIAIDGSRYVMAFLSLDSRKVIQGVSSASPGLSYIHFDRLAYELGYTALRIAFTSKASRNELTRTFEHTREYFAPNAAGYARLLQQAAAFEEASGVAKS